MQLLSGVLHMSEQSSISLYGTRDQTRAAKQGDFFKITITVLANKHL